MMENKSHIDTNKFSISSDCYLQFDKWSGVSLNYTERQADTYYPDTETEVNIDENMAKQIINWLKEKYE